VTLLNQDGMSTPSLLELHTPLPLGNLLQPFIVNNHVDFFRCLGILQRAEIEGDDERTLKQFDFISVFETLICGNLWDVRLAS
jgi:hypothetical protein